MTIDIDHLRKLLAAATTNDYAWHVEGGEFRETIVRFAAADGSGESAGWRWFQTGTAEQAELICAAINALPELLDAYEAAAKIVDARRRGWPTMEAMSYVSLEAAVDAARKEGT